MIKYHDSSGATGSVFTLPLFIGAHQSELYPTTGCSSCPRLKDQRYLCLDTCIYMYISILLLQADILLIVYNVFFYCTVITASLWLFFLFFSAVFIAVIVLLIICSWNSAVNVLSVKAHIIELLCVLNPTPAVHTIDAAYPSVYWGYNDYYYAVGERRTSFWRWLLQLHSKMDCMVASIYSGEQSRRTIAQYQKFYETVRNDGVKGIIYNNVELIEKFKKFYSTIRAQLSMVM